MRKILIFIGAAALVLLVVIGGLVFYAMSGASDIEAESRPYAEESVSAIATTWNGAEFMRRAYPPVRDSTKPEELKRLLEAFSAGLGRLVEYETKMVNFTVNVTASEGKVVVVNYAVPARFEKGSANIRLTIIKSGDVWMLHTFFVDSPALLQNLMGKPT